MFEFAFCMFFGWVLYVCMHDSIIEFREEVKVLFK